MKKVHILHIVDQATWFSEIAVMKSKKKEEIADTLKKNWITIFGTPKTILSDNGEEFNNELLCELCEQFNISVKSAAEAPWHNGIGEQHNAVLGKIINKLLLDKYSQYPTDVIFPWGVSGKSALHTCYCFRPNQLLFGRNPSPPSNLINLPPAMEDVSKADIIVKHLNALHAARKAFIEAESNEKLCHALKAKNQVTTGITYEIGDIVYYKHKDSNKWKGPGKVIGKWDKQILVKHGGYYKRVHPCSLHLVDNIGPNKSEGTPGNNNAEEFMDGTEEKIQII